ncbi:MAG: hypothetical protein C0490_27795 [Marivirga sp.]|nr:hypothetical protein [Marivirga sp.]
MKNKFFDIAVDQASRLAGKKGRILLLLSRLGTKMSKTNWSPVQRQLIKEKFFVLGRLAKAYALGRYRAVPWRAMLVLLAAVIYFLNPLDLIPDLIPVFGLTDDFAVLLWVYNAIGAEVDKFLAWEDSQATPI